MDAATKKKYTWILVSMAVLCIFAGLIGLIFGQGLFVKIGIAVTAAVAAASCAMFALAIRRTPSD
jgi:intracellular septation protein A